MNDTCSISQRREALWISRTWILLAAVVLLASAPTCDGEPREAAYRFSRFAMGTTVEYVIVAPNQPEALAAMLAAHAEVERIDSLFGEGEVRVLAGDGATEETARFLGRLASYRAITGGAFDAWIAPAMDLYDFDSENPEPPAPEAIAAALRRVEANRRDQRPMTTDLALGGVAKGYAVDRAAGVLRSRGVRGAIVNAGGDMYCLGLNLEGPWTVGVRDPDDPNEVIALLELSDQAVATSGDYQRYFVHDGERYHHLLDPATGRPARSVRGASVVASSAEEADALATALFVEGVEAGLPRIEGWTDVEGLVVTRGGMVAATTGMPLVSR